MGKKGDSTRQRILRLAFELFAENGYTKVSMQDICTRCGLSKGGLYRHYENKFRLFTDILKMMQKEEADRELSGRNIGMSAVEILDSYLKHVSDNLNNDKPNITVAIYEFCIENKDGAGPDIISSQYQRGESILLSLAEYGVSRGEFHPVDLKGLIPSILFLLEGMQMANEVMPIPETTVNDIFRQIRQMLGAGNHEQS